MPEGAVPVLDQGFVRLVEAMGDDLSIVQAARVSFGSGSKGEEKDKRLVSYLLKHDHGTPFEMVAFKFHVRCPILVARQWFRHRWGCLSGDMEVTFNRPDMWRQGLQCKQYGNNTQRFTMARLWRLWNDPRHHAKVKGMLLRVYDEEDASFTVSRLEDVVSTGVKPLYRVRTKSGKTLECTADHRLLTGKGWQTLQEAAGLELTPSGRATWEREVTLLANGVKEPWRSGSWLAARRKEGHSVSQMAEQAGCAYETIRKWLKRHDLSFSREETWFQPGHVPWNTGKRHKNPNWAHSPEGLERIRAARSGPNSNFWKGGVSSERALIGRWTREQASKVHAKFDYTCQRCGERGGDLHAHHKVPVVVDPSLARDFDNLESVCKACHHRIHGKGSVTQRKVALIGKTTVHAVEDPVVSIEFLGKRPTFDLVVRGPHHNFLANGLVVHNSFNEISGRYSKMEYRFWQPDTLRTPDTTNRQGSVEGPLDAAQQEALLARIEETTKTAYATYQALLDAGVAREMARSVLPLSLYTEFYWKVNARSLMNFLRLRAEVHAQREIRAYAVALLRMFEERLPWTAAAFREHVLGGLTLDADA